MSTPRAPIPQREPDYWALVVVLGMMALCAAVGLLTAVVLEAVLP